MSTNNEQKKTNYPDLERSPDTSFFSHLLNWVWNKPRWIFEELYEKHFLATKRELQKTKLELEIMKYKVGQLELQININKIIEERDNVTKFPTEITTK
jgi:hypothetical protein